MPIDPQYKKKLQEFLLKHPILHLSTLDEDGTPRVTTLLFFVDEDLNFFFATHPDSEKYQNILRNNAVAWAVGGFDDPKNVQAKGVAKLVQDEDMKDFFIEKLAETAGSLADFWPPVLQVGKNDYVLVQLEPKWLKILDQTDTISDKGDAYTEIEL